MEILNSIITKKMTINDLEKISSNLTTDFDDFWNYNIFKSELINPNSEYYMAILNEEIIGFIGILKVIDEAHIMNIVTKKAYRNQGIASHLLNFLIKYLKEQKEIKSLTLEVNENNKIAQKLYQKHNFKIIGKRKKYYKKDNAIIMTLFI